MVGGEAYSQLAPHDDSAGSEAFRTNRLRKLGTLLACLLAKFASLINILAQPSTMAPDRVSSSTPPIRLSPFDTQLIQDH